MVVWVCIQAVYYILQVFHTETNLFNLLTKLSYILLMLQLFVRNVRHACIYGHAVYIPCTIVIYEEGMYNSNFNGKQECKAFVCIYRRETLMEAST